MKICHFVKVIYGEIIIGTFLCGHWTRCIMALSCIVCEIQRVICPKSLKFLYPTCIWRSHSDRGWPCRNFVKVFDADNTRMIGLPYGEKKLWQYVKPFSSNTGTLRTDGQTDRRTDRFAISISRVSTLTRDKNNTQNVTKHVTVFRDNKIQKFSVDGAFPYRPILKYDCRTEGTASPHLTCSINEPRSSRWIWLRAWWL